MLILPTRVTLRPLLVVVAPVGVMNIPIPLGLSQYHLHLLRLPINQLLTRHRVNHIIILHPRNSNLHHSNLHQLHAVLRHSPRIPTTPVLPAPLTEAHLRHRATTVILPGYTLLKYFHLEIRVGRLLPHRDKIEKVETVMAMATGMAVLHVKVGWLSVIYSLAKPKILQVGDQVRTAKC